MKFATTISAFAIALSCAAAAADVTPKVAEEASPAPVPQRAAVELEPAGSAPGTTVRQARIRQNWLMLGLGSAALAGIILGLSTSDSDTATTTN